MSDFSNTKKAMRISCRRTENKAFQIWFCRRSRSRSRCRCRAQPPNILGIVHIFPPFWHIIGINIYLLAGRNRKKRLNLHRGFMEKEIASNSHQWAHSSNTNRAFRKKNCVWLVAFSISIVVGNTFLHLTSSLVKQKKIKDFSLPSKLCNSQTILGIKFLVKKRAFVKLSASILLYGDWPTLLYSVHYIDRNKKT